MRLILAFLMMTQSTEALVLVQSPQVPLLEYRAALKADPDALSPTQHFIKQRPLPAQRERLLAAFALAQRAFLENSREQASLQFQNIVSMLNEDDWARSDRGIFLHSFLRLAQMQHEDEKQKMWLRRALMAGDDLEPEPGLFPPPILRELAQLRRETPRVSLPTKIFSEGWTLILLNGRPCTKETCPGPPVNSDGIRVTFLSDVWQSVSTVLDSRFLQNFEPNKVAWVEGECGSARFSSASAVLKEPKAFWGLDCSPPMKPELNLRPVARTDLLPKLEIKDGPQDFYKSKWFWGGVGAVALVIIINGQKNKERKEPTTTYGYSSTGP